ncbi:Acetyltransferase (fragment) [Curtobacterium sp. 8I-2]
MSEQVVLSNTTAIQYGPVAQLVSVPPCHGGGRGFKSRQGRHGWIAQLVERSTENRKVHGSMPCPATGEGPLLRQGAFSVVRPV